MGKEIHPKQNYQIGKRPAELKESKDHHRNQCCPNLDLDGIRRGPHKGFKVLLQVLASGNILSIGGEESKSRPGNERK